MQGYARRSRLVALGLSVGALGGLVTAMVVNERPVATPAAGPSTSPTVTTPDPFATGTTATPASEPLTGRARRTITSAS